MSDEMNSLVPAFVKPFKTLEHFYVYDVGTNRVFRVDEVIHALIELVGRVPGKQLISQFKESFGEQEVRRALGEIGAAQAKGLFVSGFPSVYTLGPDRQGLRDKMDWELGQMLLEVSQDCNLDCHYCTFSGCYDGHRVHSSRLMSRETMEKAVDLLDAHSRDSQRVTLSFYGGEPLLNFKLIQEAVTYAKSRFSGRKCGFSMTTNATLLTRERAEYLKEHGFSVTVSIDGPGYIHDTHRVDKQGQGTYEQAIRGLKYLVEAYGGESTALLAINMVITPPHSLNDIRGLWDEQPWLPDDILVMADYLDQEGIAWLEDKSRIEKEAPITVQSNRLFARDYFADSVLAEEEKHPLGQAMYDKSLARIRKRPVFDAPLDKCHLNGCCIPGARKVFVDAHGALKICERVHEMPNIGHVETGYDYGGIFKMIDHFEAGCREKCSQCWAVRFCGFCFAHAYKKGKYDQDFKDSHCRGERNSTQNRLALYHYLLEKDQGCLDFLDNYEFE